MTTARRAQPIKLVKGGQVPIQLARDYMTYLRANRTIWTQGLRGEYKNARGWCISVRVTLTAGEINIWGPDKLQTAVPPLPLPNNLASALERCTYCLGPAAPHHRLGFAGRACTKCHTELLPSVEYPGWAN